MPNWTANAYQNALIEGHRLGNATLEYFLLDNNGLNFTQTERTAFAQATALWNEVANLNIVETQVQANAELIESLFVNGADGTSGNLGLHGTFIDQVGDNQIDTITIDGVFATPLTGSFNRSGFGWDENDANGGLQRGGIGFATIVHELGHALGLQHTHADGAGDPHVFPGVTGEQSPGNNNLNDELYSIMSYRAGPNIRPNFFGETQNWGKVGGPMAFDIATIQFLYGANMNTRTGNDNYVLPEGTAPGVFWTAIWDAGGTDAISYAGATGTTIDLRAATLQDEVGGGGFLSRVGTTFGGYTIANGVVIENANGGSGADMLMGNAANNTLNGGAGADTMVGGIGNDIYVVENAGDVVTELAGQGSDIVATTISYNVPVNVEVLQLQGTGNINSTGTAAGETIQGNSGNNTIDGGGGIDVMQGFGGNDTYAVDNSSDAVLEAAGGGQDAVYSSVDYIIATTQEIETAILTGNATVLRGDDSGNQLFGNDQVNVIDGRGGTDLMLGQGGADIFQINLEPGALDIVGDFSKAQGDRLAFTGFNAATTFVNQTSTTSFEVRDTKGTQTLADDTVQAFQLWDSYNPAAPAYTQGTLVFNQDYYFG